MKRLSDGGKLEAIGIILLRASSVFISSQCKVVSALKGGIFLSVILEQGIKDFPLRIGESL